MTTPRGMTSCVFQIDELTDSTEEVIFDMDGVKVSVIKYVKRENNLYVALELGERFKIESKSSSGESIYPMDFQRIHNGEVTCPFGLTDQALAAILKFRLEQKRNRDDTPLIDTMVYGEWIQTLTSIIED